MREVVEKMGSDLRTEMREMGSDLRKDLGSVQSSLGSLYEGQNRAVIAQMFGGKYSQQLTALSLQDFVLMLPDSAVVSPESATDFKQSLEAALKMTSRLADEHIPVRLLHSIHDRVQVGKLASEVQVSVFQLFPRIGAPDAHLPPPTSVCCCAAR